MFPCKVKIDNRQVELYIKHFLNKSQKKTCKYFCLICRSKIRLDWEFNHFSLIPLGQHTILFEVPIIVIAKDLLVTVAWTAAIIEAFVTFYFMWVSEILSFGFFKLHSNSY